MAMSPPSDRPEAPDALREDDVLRSPSDRPPPKRSYTRRRAQSAAVEPEGPKPAPTIIEASVAAHREQARATPDDAQPTMIDRSIFEEDDEDLPPELAEFKAALLRTSRPISDAPADLYDEDEAAVQARASRTVPMAPAKGRGSGPVAKTLPLELPAVAPERASAPEPAPAPETMQGPAPEPAWVGGADRRSARSDDVPAARNGATVAERPAMGSGGAPPSGFFDEEPERVSAPRPVAPAAPAAGGILKTRQVEAARVEDVTGEQRLERPAVPAALAALRPAEPPAPPRSAALWWTVGAAVLVAIALVAVGIGLALS